tara:strand:- start:46016 stop:46369 length:354 start_codon:yes stop_codon:yes gene_type:complete
MKKIYHLASCSTCQRIIKEINPGSEIVLQDIKSEAISEQELDEMAKMAGSYEALFSRRAMKYRSLGLNERELSEDEYRKWILEEYTFLKRPVIISENQIFIGNSKKIVKAASEHLGK